MIRTRFILLRRCLVIASLVFERANFLVENFWTGGNGLKQRHNFTWLLNHTSISGIKMI